MLEADRPFGLLSVGGGDVDDDGRLSGAKRDESIIHNLRVRKQVMVDGVK